MLFKSLQAEAILQRVTQCKRKQILMIKKHLPYNFALNQVKCKNNDQTYLFHCINTEEIKLFPCSTQLSTKFILLINVKMPIVGILTFISMINTTSERLKARHFIICVYFNFYEQLKFRAQLS